jgi:hypothetical protein
MARTLEVTRNRMALGFVAFPLLAGGMLLVTILPAKTTTSSSPRDTSGKTSPLRWDPPRVDAAIPSLSATPACSLPDVLKQTGQRAEELVDHLQKFAALEQVRYQQTDRQGMLQIYLAPKFDYVVDFGKSFEPLMVHETRTPLSGVDDRHVGSILDKGLPVLALIFHPALQSDYEMYCEGAAQWKEQPAWVVHFRQKKGRRPRTVMMETPVEVYPRPVSATELRPLSIKGRAWIAADSGQVLHLESTLVDPILEADLSELATSVDYAPVRSDSLRMEIWLPKYAVAYTDYAERRMIIEHSFSGFQLFSVQTRETMQKPREP